jgi:hypothetical protein
MSGTIDVKDLLPSSFWIVKYFKILEKCIAEVANNALSQVCDFLGGALRGPPRETSGV